jgi:hypothetical protein
MDENTTEYLKDKLVGLAHVRNGLEWLKKRQGEMLAVITESDEYKALQEEIDLYIGDKEILEGQIKDAALAEYISSGEKRPHPLVGIRVYKKFQLINEAEAIEYVVSQMPAALKVDWKQVEKLAKAGLDVPGTALRDEPKATLPKEINITEGAIK